MGLVQADVSKRLLTPRLFLFSAASGGNPGAALDNVTTADLADGALCWVLQNASGLPGLFVLDKQSTAVVNTDSCAPTPESAGGTGPGRWLLVTPGSPGAPNIVNVFNDVAPGAITPDTDRVDAITMGATGTGLVVPGSIVDIIVEATVLVSPVSGSSAWQSGLELFVEPTPAAEFSLADYEGGLLEDIAIDSGTNDQLTHVIRGARLNYTIPDGTTALGFYVRGFDPSASGGFEYDDGTLSAQIIPRT